MYLSCLGDGGWSTPVALTDGGRSGFECLPLEWSPDGDALLISVRTSPGTPAEYRIIHLDDGPEPRAASTVVLGAVRMASWVGTDQLVTVTVGADQHERLEIRSVQGLALKVLDALDLKPGEFGQISYRLSPSRTRIVWSVNTHSRDTTPQDRKVWIKVCRLDKTLISSAPPTPTEQPGPVTLTVSARIDKTTLHGSGSTTVPDGALIAWSVYNADGELGHLGIAEVVGGRYSFTVDLPWYAAGSMKVNVQFSTIVRNPRQPNSIIRLYGELGERITGPKVDKTPGGIRRVQDSTNLTYSPPQ